ncbi:MAG: hypothetical protein BKP49_07760 [Treponema sp. CETP13]|nr:MAG: hypothetical protein BKP49_07760 [Treponema sp. CETP13]
MKRFIFSLIFALTIASGISATPSFSLSLGGDFFNYEKAFLAMDASCVVPIKKGMELDMGANFGITTRVEDSTTEALFYIPLNLGLNFLFNEESKLNYLVGTGLSPQFQYIDESRFYMGPYLKGGVRVKVHEYMKWFLEAQQDLLIGPPNWINTTTSIKTGILFSFGS